MPQKRSAPKEWLVQLGLPAGGFALGLALMGFLQFWVGAFIAFLCLYFGFRDWKRFAKARRVGKIQKWSGYASITIIFAYLCWYVFRPSPLEVNAQLAGQGYTEDSAGMHWNPNFGDVRVTIENPSERDYEDLDFVLDPTVEIMQITEISNWSVNLQPRAPRPGEMVLDQFTLQKSLELQGIDLGPGGPTLKGKGPDGQSEAIPVIPRADRAASSYRIWCAKLPKKSTIQLVAAVARLNRPINGQLPPVLIAPLGAIHCIPIYGSFKANNKDVEITDKCEKSKSKNSP